MDYILDPVRDMVTTIARWLPSLLGALIVLLIGYLIAKAVEGLARRGLRAAGFDRLLHKGTGGSYIERVVKSPAKLVGSVVFWLIWLLTLSIAVTVLGVPALTNFVNAIYSYVPNVVAALLIFLVAGAVSTGAATVVNRIMGDTPTGKVLETVVPVVTMLIATFMILNQLQIAREIVVITYAGIVGAVSLGLALAFGLGGRSVAGELLEQAYESSKVAAARAKRDAETGAERAKGELREGHSNRLDNL